MGDTRPRCAPKSSNISLRLIFCIGFLSDSALSRLHGISGLVNTSHLKEACQPEVADHFALLRGVLVIYSCQLSSFELIKMTSAKISKVTISNSNYIGLIVIVLYCIVFIHFYRASHSLSLSEAHPTTAMISVELVSCPGFSWTLVTPLRLLSK